MNMDMRRLLRGRKKSTARLRLEASKTTGILADGTDDVQLVVTVLDRDGRELSNSPGCHTFRAFGAGRVPDGAFHHFFCR